MKRLQRWTSRLQPPHYVYLVVHVVLAIVGVVMLQTPKEVLKALGVGLLATAITGLVTFLYVAYVAMGAQKLETIRRFGIVDIFNMRAAAIKAEYDKRLATVKGHIDIMGFGLRALREDYLDEFPNWARRATVRILLIDPEHPDPSYPYSEQRDREEHNDVGTISRDVKKFLADIKRVFADDIPQSFQVKLYRCLPSINVFRVDEELFWGPYLVKKQSRNTPTVVCEGSGALFITVLEHFDNIWQDTRLSQVPPSLESDG